MNNNTKQYSLQDLKSIAKFIIDEINSYPDKGNALNETNITVLGGKMLVDAVKKQSDTIYCIRDKSLDRRAYNKSIMHSDEVYPITTYKFHLFYLGNYLNTYTLDNTF